MKVPFLLGSLLLLSPPSRAFAPQIWATRAPAPKAFPLPTNVAASRSNGDQNQNIDSVNEDSFAALNNLEKNRLSNLYTSFDHAKWLEHRASDRSYRSLVSNQLNPILQSLLDEVALLAGIAAAIILWNELLVEGYTDLAGLHHEAPYATSQGFPPCQTLLAL